ncbi:hypothetical protein ACHAQH_005753 [Verticillium albo-atrum]
MSYPVLRKTSWSKDAAISKSLAGRQQEAYDKHVKRIALHSKDNPPIPPSPPLTLAYRAAKLRKAPASASLTRPKPKVPPPSSKTLAVPGTRKPKTTSAPASCFVAESKPATSSRPKTTVIKTQTMARQKTTFVPPSRPVPKVVFPTVGTLQVLKARQALVPLSQPMNPTRIDAKATSTSLYNTDGDLITDEIVAKMWPVRIPPSAHPQADFLSKFTEHQVDVEQKQESNSYDSNWWEYSSPKDEAEPQAQPANIEDSFLRWLDSPEEDFIAPEEPQISLEDRLVKLTMSASISVPDEPQGHRSRLAVSPTRPAWSILLPSQQMKFDQDDVTESLSRFRDDDDKNDPEATATGRAWDEDFALDPAAQCLPAIRQDRLPARLLSLAALDAHLDAMDIPRSGYHVSRAPPSTASASDRQSTAPSTAPPTRVISRTSKIPEPTRKTRQNDRRHRFIFFH